MPITLDDAMERAKLMAGTGGLLSQHAYALLYDSLDEKDRYAFNMSLVDHGIIAKTSSTDVNRLRASVFGKPDTKISVCDVVDEDSYLREKLSLAAKKLVNAQYDVDESGQVTYGGGEQQAPFDGPDPAAVEQLRSTLEAAGISVSADGKVSFYKSSVPGVYTDRLPQSMPIDTAVSYYSQVSRTAKNEADRAGKVLDGLSRVSAVSEDVSGTLSELKTYKFSPKSQSEVVRSIAEGLSTIIGFFESGQLETLEGTLEKLKSQLEQYKFDQEARADSYSTTYDALSQLKAAKDSDPGLYDAVIKGLGGV